MPFSDLRNVGPGRRRLDDEGAYDRALADARRDLAALRAAVSLRLRNESSASKIQASGDGGGRPRGEDQSAKVAVTTSRKVVRLKSPAISTPDHLRLELLRARFLADRLGSAVRVSRVKDDRNAQRVLVDVQTRTPENVIGHRHAPADEFGASRGGVADDDTLILNISANRKPEFEPEIPLFEATLNDRERVLGPDHPYTLASRNNLAGAYRSAGDLGQAIPLFEQTLTDRARVLGPDHPDTLTTGNNLANSYLSAGRTNDAITLHEQVLADRIEVLGNKHPDTLTSRHNLANSYRSAGRTNDAIILHEQVLADRIEILGNKHPDTLQTRNNLASFKRVPPEQI